MNDATKLRIRRELAERMGWEYRPECCQVNGSKRDCWMDLAGDCHSEPPDPFTDHTDCAALVEWLAGQSDEVRERFERGIEEKVAPYGIFSVLTVLTSSLKTRVLAACAALGIDTGDE